MRTERLVAASGAAAVIAVAVGDPLATSTHAGTLLDQVRQGRTPAQVTGMVLELGAMCSLLLFVAYLSHALVRAEGPDGWAGRGALCAGLAATTIKLGSAAAVVAEVYRADVLTPDTARTLEDLNGGAFVVSACPWGLFVALAAGSSFASRALPRWLAVGGLVVGVLSVVAGVAGVVDPAAYVPIPYLLCLLWILLASLVLTARGGRPGAAATERAPQAAATEPTARA